MKKFKINDVVYLSGIFWDELWEKNLYGCRGEVSGIIKKCKKVLYTVEVDTPNYDTAVGEGEDFYSETEWEGPL